MKLFKILWSFIGPLADIFGILGFLGVSIKRINFDNISWYIWLILILSSLILLKIIIKNIKKIREIYRDEKVSQDLERIVLQKNIKNVEQAFPKTETLRRLYQKIQKRINEWTDDAEIKSFNFYIEYLNGSWVKPSIQVIAYSKWKNEEGWFYDGRNKTENFNENEQVYAGKILPEENMFFNLNPKWQTVANKAFNAVSNKLTNECKIRIDEDSLRIEFREGKVNKIKKFKVLEKFSQIIPD